MRLKQNKFHLWKITYIENIKQKITTLFNSGLIDDANVVKNYFISQYPELKNVEIELCETLTYEQIENFNKIIKEKYGH